MKTCTSVIEMQRERRHGRKENRRKKRKKKKGVKKKLRKLNPYRKYLRYIRRGARRLNKKLFLKRLTGKLQFKSFPSY